MLHQWVVLTLASDKTSILVNMASYRTALVHVDDVGENHSPTTQNTILSDVDATDLDGDGNCDLCVLETPLQILELLNNNLAEIAIKTMVKVKEHG
jgi:hypothetical protein